MGGEKDGGIKKTTVRLYADAFHPHTPAQEDALMKQAISDLDALATKAAKAR